MRQGENDGFTDIGNVKISDEVVAAIAGMTAVDVPGVVGMSAGLVGGIADLIGKKNPAKGVKVHIGEREVAVDLYIVVEYGQRIPDVALIVQEKVKEAIETSTGMAVVEVNVHVQGVGFTQDEPENGIRVR